MLLLPAVWYTVHAGSDTFLLREGFASWVLPILWDSSEICVLVSNFYNRLFIPRYENKCFLWLRWGTRQRSWLKHYATSRNVPGWIPDELIEFLQLT
jgi:hypothetical protein